MATGARTGPTVAEVWNDFKLVRDGILGSHIVCRCARNFTMIFPIVDLEVGLAFVQCAWSAD